MRRVCLSLYLISISFFLPEFSLIAQQKTKAENQLDRLFKNRGELYFRFFLKRASDMPELTRAVSIDHRKGDTLFAFANRRGMQRFFELGYSKYKILETPAEAFRRMEKKEKRRKKKADEKSAQAFDSYPTYTAYEQAMAQFQNQFPGICRLVNLGTLPSGRKILALKISDSVNVNQNEPRFLYTSSMHGDETAGYPMMLKLADTLLHGYGNDTELTRLVNEMEIWINPLANPDGTYRTGNQSVSGATRFNANNIDLNRNYPDPQDGPHPDGEAWQPETKLFMKLADSLEFVMAANFHGGAEVWNFPWDTWQRRHADENWWTAEGVKFTGSARANSASYFNELYGYPNLPGVCQGFEWYEVNGGRQDYMNWFHSCREVTLELSDVKLITNAQIPVHWQWLRRSLIDFMKAGLRGIRGKITDACTGLPVPARIEVRNHDKDNTHIFSTASLGNYHRPIFPGTYSLLVSAPGYRSDSIPGVTVDEGNAQIRNLSLQPLAPPADFRAIATSLCEGNIGFQDQSGSAAIWNWNFGDGSSSSEKNPQHVFSAEGNYAVQLIVSNCAGIDTIQKLITINRPAKPTTLGDTSNCGAVVQRLQAFSANPLRWYSATGMLLDSNQQFFTPALDSTKVYYVSSSKQLAVPNAGPVNNQFGSGSFFTGNTYHYLSFDAQLPFRLKSVKVYANTSGNRNIQLRNAQGQVIRSKTVAVPQGESRVQLNFDVDAGEALQLGLAGGASNNLFRNNGGAVYPYEIPGLLRITGNSAGNPAFYYYFYDWEISASCQSDAVPVAAVVQAPRPQVNISVFPDSVCEGTEIQLQASFSQAIEPQFTWFDGVLPLGTGNNLLVNLSGAGNHSITCRLLSADTCAVKNPALSPPRQVHIRQRPPAPVIYQNGNWLVSGSGPVSWFQFGEPIGIGVSDSVLISANGSYTAILTGPNGCSSLSSTLSINRIKDSRNGLFHMHYFNGLLVAENNSGRVQEIELVHPNGQMVQRYFAGDGFSEFSLQQLAPGLLIARNRNNGQVLKLMR